MNQIRYKRTSKKRGRPSKKSIEAVNLELTHAQEHQMRQARRSALVKGGDPVMASYPLGVLLARGIIDQGQHDAGQRYAYYYGRMFGRTVPGVSDNWHEDSEQTAAIIEEKYREASALLMSQSRQIKDAVENAAVFHRFIIIDEWADKARRRVERLQIGLKVLDRWIRG